MLPTIAASNDYAYIASYTAFMLGQTLKEEKTNRFLAGLVCF